MRTRTSATGSRCEKRLSHQRQCTPRRDREGAFTLLELIVTLTLIAVLAGLIVPRMGRSIGRRELREAAGRFVQTARTVRELAVARQEVRAMKIDLDEGRYYPAKPKRDGEGAAFASRDGEGAWEPLRASWLKPQRWPEAVTVDSYRTPDGLQVVGGTQCLKFFPDGTSSGAAIRLVSREDAYDIVVHPHSGRVVYEDAGRASRGADATSSAGFALDRYDLGD